MRDTHLSIQNLNIFTDGCAEQYKSRRNAYFIAELAQEYSIDPSLAISNASLLPLGDSLADELGLLPAEHAAGRGVHDDMPPADGDDPHVHFQDTPPHHIRAPEDPHGTGAHEENGGDTPIEGDTDNGDNIDSEGTTESGSDSRHMPTGNSGPPNRSMIELFRNGGRR